MARRPTRLTLGRTLAAFAGLRILTITIVAILHPSGAPWLPPKGDIAWYLSIIEYGYDYPNWITPDRLEPSNLAFFPLATWLAEPLYWAGVPPAWAMAAVATGASFLAAWAIYRIGERLHGARVGFFLAVAWGCVLPTSIALSLPLSESVYSALAAWALLFMLRGELIPAGLATAAAGLSRPAALVLLLPLIWVAAGRARERRDIGRAIAAVLVAPLGALAFVAFVATRMGRPGGYLRVQQTFGSKVDFGASWFGTLWDLVSGGPGPVHNWITVLTVVAVALLLVALMLERPPPEIVLFTAGSLFLIVIQSGHLTTVQRFILPVFPLLLPLAVGLARLRWQLSAAVIILMAVLTAWYGAYLLYEAKINLV